MIPTRIWSCLDVWEIVLVVWLWLPSRRIVKEAAWWLGEALRESVDPIRCRFGPPSIQLIEDPSACWGTARSRVRSFNFSFSLTNGSLHVVPAGKSRLPSLTIDATRRV
jgi:hypothetical protein